MPVASPRPARHPSWPAVLSMLIAVATFVCLLPTQSANAADTSPEVIQRPIPIGETRIALSLDYLKTHYDIVATRPHIDPQMIVVHWTAVDGLEASYRIFTSETLPGYRKEIQAGGQVNVSAHFLVDTDGTIYQLLPETFFARHVIGLNHCAIGIENVGGTSGSLTDAQLRANVALVRSLQRRYPKIRYLLGHHEYLRFETSPLFLEKDPTYRTRKIDPGDKFMTEMRNALADLYRDKSLLPIPAL